jgi:hypothetical protein
MKSSVYFGLILWIGLPLISVSGLYAGPTVSVGRSVPASQQVSMDQIDHHEWNRLLIKYVDVRGNVGYAAWKASSQDQQSLDAYLATLSTASLSAPASRAAKLAFWINAYNAVTIKGILREYPTTSIRNHTAKLIGYNIWDDLLLTVGGHGYSLNQMEHEILRKLGEPRIHFAIVCASKSCPRLLNEAYAAERLEEQLAANSQNFFANANNFRFDASRQAFQLSSILDWFGEDFGSSVGAQLQAIAPYLPSEQAKQAASRGTGSVSYLDYDWGLNDR